MCWQFGQQSAVGANGVQSALFWCRGAQSARAAYPPIFVLPQVPAAPRTLSCEDCARTVPCTFPCAHTGSVPCQLEVRVGLQAFPGSLGPNPLQVSSSFSANQAGSILNHSLPRSQSHISAASVPSHCHLIKLLKLTKHLRHPVAPTPKITCQPYMACQR